MGIHTEYLIGKRQNVAKIQSFDASLVGLITRVVNTALQRFRGFLASFFYDPIVVEKDPRISSFQLSIKNLEASGEQITTISTATYLQSLLIEDSPESKRTLLIDSFLSDGQSNGNAVEIEKTLECAIKLSLNENTKFIAIPLIVKGCKGKHITLVLVELKRDDTTNKVTGGTIRYFDSFGKSFVHEHNTMNETSAGDIIGMVKTILGSSEEPNAPKFETWHEAIQIQFDTHSCGIFVGEYFRLTVIEGMTHEQAMDILKARNIEDTRDSVAKAFRAKLPEIQNSIIRAPYIEPERVVFTYDNMPKALAGKVVEKNAIDDF